MAERLSLDEILRQELNQRLHDAALAGDVVKLREAISAGADVEAPLIERRIAARKIIKTKPLTCVSQPSRVKKNRAEKGRTACVRALLDAGASASVAVYSVHYAAFSGFATICRLLLDAGAGAELNARTSGGFTPLSYAAIKKHHRVVVLLLSRGATTDGCIDKFETYYSPGYLSRISSAGGFANYQKQQRAKLMAMLAPKMSHLLPPELVSHIITFWGHLGWT